MIAIGWCLLHVALHVAYPSSQHSGWREAADFLQPKAPRLGVPTSKVDAGLLGPGSHTASHRLVQWLHMS